MNKHDNIYNILGKLAALQPQTAEPVKQESILKQLNEGVEAKPLSLKDRLNARFAAIKENKEVDEDMLAKKDYDGDGEVESGKDEYMGSKDKAIKKAMGKSDKSEKNSVVDEGVTTQSWMKDPQDPASKVPAFQRKANEPGRQAAQANVDNLNQKSGAAVWRNPRAVQPTMDEDGDNAYATLPEVRKTSEEEHAEYKAAAHELRKWMRKRGWDTKKEFKSALKYVMDNLDSKHDDTLTDKVKEAACTCDKHHKALVAEQPVEEGFPTVADARARAEKEKGTGKFDVQKTSTGTRYTRKSDTFSDDGDDGEKSASDAPKKRGRPAKNKGPERTTSKAWKHKGGRVTESINIETYVEDTIAELENLFIIEKAKSKDQAVAARIARGVQKGEVKAKKGSASAEMAKMEPKELKKFAKTDTKGLPKKVTESVLIESTLQAIVRRFGKEVREFANGGDIDQDLFEALYDYYFDDMPYGVKKARDGDPYEWVADHFHAAIENGDVEVNEARVAMTDAALDELALLAGLTGGQHKLDKNHDNKLSAVDFAMLRGDTNESSCNMTAEGQACPVHGMAECGMYEGAKPDFLDVDKDGDEKESFKKALDDKEDGSDEKEDLDECGMSGGMGTESGVSINSSMDTKTGRKTLSVTADGEAAEQLAKMLKMAGLGGGTHSHHDDSHSDEIEVHTMDGGEIEVGEEYSNEPEEMYGTTDAIIKQGGDLNRPKRQDPATANRAANPMSEDVSDLVNRLQSMYARSK